MVDNSTQTPREDDSAKQEEEVTVEDAETTGVAPDNKEQDNKQGTLLLDNYGLSPIPVPSYVYQKTRVTRSFHPKCFINLGSSSNTYRYSFFARTVKEWNTLPDHLIKQQTDNSFNSAVAAYLNHSPV